MDTPDTAAGKVLWMHISGMWKPDMIALDLMAGIGIGRAGLRSRRRARWARCLFSSC